MSQLKMYRQGDILFVRAERIPKYAILLNHSIIAEGEATGHLHRVKEKEVKLYEDGTVKWLEAGSEITIVHDEHLPLKLKTGTYKIVRQREYNPHIAGRYSYVAD